MATSLEVLKRVEMQLSNKLVRLNERIEHLNKVVAIDEEEWGTSPAKDLLDSAIKKRDATKEALDFTSAQIKEKEINRMLGHRGSNN